MSLDISIAEEAEVFNNNLELIKNNSKIGQDPIYDVFLGDFTLNPATVQVKRGMSFEEFFELVTVRHRHFRRREDLAKHYSNPQEVEAWKKLNIDPKHPENPVAFNEAVLAKMVKEGLFFCGATVSGGRRGDQFASGISFLVYDIDKMKDGTSGVSEEAFLAITGCDIGFRYGWYESASSKIGARKFRIIIPLINTFPLSVNDKDNYNKTYDMVWRYLFGSTPEGSLVTYDTACTDITRLFFTMRKTCVDGHKASFGICDDLGDFLDFAPFFQMQKSKPITKSTTRTTATGTQLSSVPPQKTAQFSPTKNFTFREEKTIKYFQERMERAVAAGTRNNELNLLVFEQWPLLRERYFNKEEMDEIREEFIKIGNATYDSQSDGPQGAYEKANEKTVDSAIKRVGDDMGRDYNRMNKFQKDAYNFFFKTEYFFTKVVGKTSASLMDDFRKVVFSENIICFTDCIYMLNENTNYWTSLSQLLHGEDRDIDSQKILLSELIRTPLKVKLDLMEIRFREEEAAVLSENPAYYIMLKKKLIPADEQFDKFTSLIQKVRSFYSMFADDIRAVSENIKRLVNGGTLSQSQIEDLWQDRNLPDLQSPEKIKFPFSDGRVLGYNKDKGEFEITKAEPKDYIRREYAQDMADFDPLARYNNPAWDAFINGLFSCDEDRDWFKMFVGSSLLMDGSGHEKLTFLYGGSRTGKSTLIEKIFKKVFSDNIIGTVSQRIFGSPDGPSSEHTSMNKRRISTISEFTDESGKVLSAALKSTISSDSVEVRGHFSRETVSIRKKGIVICCANTNKIPSFQSDDNAVWQRLAILETPHEHRAICDPRFDPKKHKPIISNLDHNILSGDKRAIIQWFFDGALMFIKGNEEAIKNMTPNMWRLLEEVRYERGESFRHILERYITPVDPTFLTSVAGQSKSWARVPVSALLDISMISESYSKRGFTVTGAIFTREVKAAGYDVVRSNGRDRNGKELCKVNCIEGYRWANLDITLRDMNNLFLPEIFGFSR